MSNDCTLTVPVFFLKYSDRQGASDYHCGQIRAIMETTTVHKILLYGNSILIARLTSKLRLQPGWEVARVDGDESPENLDEVEFIVADLRDARTPRLLPRLAKTSAAALIGLDALTNTVTLLAAQEPQSPTTQGMLSLLRESI